MARGNKTSPRKLLALQRQKDAIALRLRNKSYQEIGDALGISRQAAQQFVMKWYEENRAETAENGELLRQIEIAKVDRDYAELESLAWASVDILERDLVVSKIAAIAERRKLLERRAKYLGLDAPNKSEVSGPNGGPLQAGVIAVPMQVPLNEWATTAQKAAANDEASTQKLLESLTNGDGTSA